MVVKRRVIIKRASAPVLPADLPVDLPAEPKVDAKPRTRSKAKAIVSGPASTKVDIPGLIGDPPCSLQEGQGAKIHADQRGVVTVTLDPGAYRLVWELAESALVSNHRKYEGILPDLVGASVRAVNAMRSAVVVIPEPEAKKRRGKKVTA